MRIRIPLIVEETLLAKIDEIAGEKHRRAATIETALREFIAREEKKARAKPVEVPVKAAKPVAGSVKARPKVKAAASARR